MDSMASCSCLVSLAFCSLLLELVHKYKQVATHAAAFHRPCRVRVLDLPFAAVEWLLPTLPLNGEPEALQLATLGWQRSVDQAG